jgi:hypothetical protein
VQDAARSFIRNPETRHAGGGVQTLVSVPLSLSCACCQLNLRRLGQPHSCEGEGEKMSVGSDGRHPGLRPLDSE